MSAALTIEGYAEYVRAIETLPQVLDAEGEATVRATTELTASQLKANYPTADLKGGVRTRYLQGAPGVEIGRVESMDDEANLWEFGTQDRKTAQGWRRGRSPEHRQAGLVPLAMTNRSRMVEHLRQFVDALGFEVSGDASHE